MRISETFMRGLAQLLYNTMDKLLRVPVMQFTAYPDVLQSLNSLFRTRYKGVEPKREKRHFSAFFDWSVLSMRMQVILDSLLFNPHSRPQRPRSFWSAPGSPSDDQKNRGVWEREYFNRYIGRGRESSGTGLTLTKTARTKERARNYLR